MGQTSKGEERLKGNRNRLKILAAKRTKKYLKGLLAKKCQMIFILFLFYLHAYATITC